MPVDLVTALEGRNPKNSFGFGFSTPNNPRNREIIQNGPTTYSVPPPPLSNPESAKSPFVYINMHDYNSTKEVWVV